MACGGQLQVLVVSGPGIVWPVGRQQGPDRPEEPDFRRGDMVGAAPEWLWIFSTSYGSVKVTIFLNATVQEE